jgi:hypothetical protein
MKRVLRWIGGLGAVVALSLILSTSVFAGNSYSFSFGYNSGGYRSYGCSPRYAYSYSYCPPPVYYYPPPPPVAYRYYYGPPVYYYYGSGSYCR